MVRLSFPAKVAVCVVFPPPCRSKTKSKTRQPEYSINMAAGVDDDKTALRKALRFAAVSENAVVLTAFPGCTKHLDHVREWLASLQDVEIVLETPASVDGRDAQVLATLALYAGEEWLVSNCWYHEQPLPGGKPTGAYPGAQWKRDLCFRDGGEEKDGREGHEEVKVLHIDCCRPLSHPAQRPRTLESELTVFVLRVGRGGDPWRAKYTFRARLASLTGRPGNSCIHLTDRQPEGGAAAEACARERALAVAAAAAAATPGELSAAGVATGSAGCDASYAFACARALLHPSSLRYLTEQAAGRDAIGSEAFRLKWACYIEWLWQPLNLDEEGGELRTWEWKSK